MRAPGLARRVRLPIQDQSALPRYTVTTSASPAIQTPNTTRVVNQPATFLEQNRTSAARDASPQTFATPPIMTHHQQVRHVGPVQRIGLT